MDALINTAVVVVTSAYLGLLVTYEWQALTSPLKNIRVYVVNHPEIQIPNITESRSNIPTGAITTGLRVVKDNLSKPTRLIR